MLQTVPRFLQTASRSRRTTTYAGAALWAGPAALASMGSAPSSLRWVHVCYPIALTNRFRTTATSCTATTTTHQTTARRCCGCAYQANFPDTMYPRSTACRICADSAHLPPYTSLTSGMTCAIAALIPSLSGLCRYRLIIGFFLHSGIVHVLLVVLLEWNIVIDVERVSNARALMWHLMQSH